MRKQSREYKETLVKERHINLKGEPYLITPVTFTKSGKQVTKWTTRAPWMGGKNPRIQKNSRDELVDFLYDHYKGTLNSEYTVTDVYLLWMEERKETEVVSSLTLEHNKADWERYWAGRPLTEKEKAKGKEPIKGSPIVTMRIRDVQPHDISRHYKYLVGDGKLSKKTFTNIRSVINGVFAYAYEHDIDCIDPSRITGAKLHFKQPADHSHDVYTAEERDKLLSYLAGLKKQNSYSLAIQLMFCLCCRIGELRALKWEDYTVTADGRPIIKLRHQMVDKVVGDRNRVATDVDYMKGRCITGKREFPLTPYAVKVLDELHALHPNSEYICCSDGSLPVTTNNFNEYLRRYCERAGVPYRSSHKIRFYAVSRMYDMGVDEKTIMALAGHSNVSTTRHYNRKLKDIEISQEKLIQGFDFEDNFSKKSS